MKNKAVLAVLAVVLTTALLLTCLGCATAPEDEMARKLQLYCLAQYEYFQLEKQKELLTELQHMNNSMGTFKQTK
jgi:hypothetical protein